MFVNISPAFPFLSFSFLSLWARAGIWARIVLASLSVHQRWRFAFFLCSASGSTPVTIFLNHSTALFSQGSRLLLSWLQSCSLYR